MKPTKRELLIALSLVVIFIVWLSWPKIFPPAKPHAPVKTFALWFIDPKSGRDTGTTVFRMDYDTTYPYKRWDTPRYYLPLNKIDTIKRAGLSDSVSVQRAFLLTADPVIIIHDFDKHY